MLPFKLLSEWVRFPSPPYNIDAPFPPIINLIRGFILFCPRICPINICILCYSSFILLNPMSRVSDNKCLYVPVNSFTECPKCDDEYLVECSKIKDYINLNITESGAPRPTLLWLEIQHIYETSYYEIFEKEVRK